MEEKGEMTVWAKGILAILLVWAVAVSLFLALDTAEQREQNDRLWCLELGVTTLQIGIGRVAATVNENVKALQSWSRLEGLEILPPGAQPALPPPDHFVLSDAEWLASGPSADVVSACELGDEFGLD
jgi:hypothetical protein